MSSAASSQDESGRPGNRSMATRFKGKMRNEDQKHGANKRKPDNTIGAENELQVINLSSHIFSDNDISVLRKGLTFSPSAAYDTFTAIKDLHLFARKLLFKRWFHKGAEDDRLNTKNDQEVVRILEELLAENEDSPREGPSDDRGRIPACICKKSQKFPPTSLCPAIDVFVTKDFENISPGIRQDNLTSVQRASLKRLKNIKYVVYKPADKVRNIAVWPKL